MCLQFVFKIINLFIGKIFASMAGIWKSYCFVCFRRYLKRYTMCCIKWMDFMFSKFLLTTLDVAEAFVILQYDEIHEP